MQSVDSKKELPPAQKFKKADINANFRTMFGIETEMEEINVINTSTVQEDKEKMLAMNIIETPPLSAFSGARSLPSISASKHDLLSSSSDITEDASSLSSSPPSSPIQEHQRGKEQQGSSIDGVSGTKMPMRYPVDSSQQGGVPKESFAKSILAKTRAYSHSIMLLTKGKKRVNGNDSGSESGTPRMDRPLINPRVAELGRPKSNSLKMLSTPANVNDKFRAWQRKSMMEQMEASQIIKDKRYKLLLEAQQQRILTETPRAVQLEIIEQAYPIVLKVCQHYIKHLGEKHEITQAAITRLSHMAAELDRECEYTPLS